MSLLHALIVLLTVYYCVVVLGLILGLGRIRFRKSATQPLVSVIVAARNEEQTIGSLLSQLTRQTYPTYEIIVVNDRSADRTGNIVAAFEGNHRNLKKIEIKNPSADMPAKKNALAQGIAASKGEILCLTDADCIPQPEWILELVAAFDEQTGLVTGYSPYDASHLTELQRGKGTLKSIFHSFVEYEEFRGATWSAGAIGLGKGWLCTGRNLAYRRAVYDQVGGFESIKHSVSGDDDLFLQLVRQRTEWKIRYATDPKSFVVTLPPASLRSFIQQRIRHFSAAKYFSPSMKLFFLLFHGANLILLLSILGALIWNGPAVFYWTFAAKLVSDTLLFLRAAPPFAAWKFAPSFVFMEILYIFYNTVVGPLGMVKRFEWKTERRS